MTIREVEQCTGLPKQTIRYYEKEGLLHPTRQEGNAYRNFSEEDVRTLKLIKVFRKLDFPLATVKQMLQGETDLQLALEEQIKALQQTAEQLESYRFAACTRRTDQGIAADRRTTGELY